MKFQFDCVGRKIITHIKCPNILCLVGYTNSDVIYKWKNPQKAVEIADDMKLSQFDLVDCPAGNMTDKIGHNKNDPDMLITVPYVCKYRFVHSLECLNEN